MLSCVGVVLSDECVGVEPSKPRVSTQPQLAVFPQTPWMLMCLCMVMGQYSRMSFSSDQNQIISFSSGQVTGTVFPHLNMPFLPNSEFI